MKTAKLKAPPRLAYYHVGEHWRCLAPLYRSPAARRIWLPDMRDYRVIRPDEAGLDAGRDDRHYRTSSEFDSNDWRYDAFFLGRGTRPIRRPAYWDFVYHSACHWLLKLNIWFVTLVEPERDWRVLTSPLHSILWDGGSALFELNFLALRVSATEAWEMAVNQEDAKSYIIHRG